MGGRWMIRFEIMKTTFVNPKHTHCKDGQCDWLVDWGLGGMKRVVSNFSIRTIADDVLDGWRMVVIFSYKGKWKMNTKDDKHIPEVTLSLNLSTNEGGQMRSIVTLITVSLCVSSLWSVFPSFCPALSYQERIFSIVVHRPLTCRSLDSRMMWQTVGRRWFSWAVRGSRWSFWRVTNSHRSVRATFCRPLRWGPIRDWARWAGIWCTEKWEGNYLTCMLDLN